MSRALTYDFHYDKIKNNYGNNSTLLLTDTDNLMYEVKSEDVCEYFSNIITNVRLSQNIMIIQRK